MSFWSHITRFLGVNPSVSEHGSPTTRVPPQMEWRRLEGTSLRGLALPDSTHWSDGSSTDWADWRYVHRAFSPDDRFVCWIDPEQQKVIGIRTETGEVAFEISMADLILRDGTDRYPSGPMTFAWTTADALLVQFALSEQEGWRDYAAVFEAPAIRQIHGIEFAYSYCDAGHPLVSPDRRHVVLQSRTSNTGMQIFDAVSGELLGFQRSDSDKSSWGDYVTGCWSPSGRYFALLDSVDKWDGPSPRSGRAVVLEIQTRRMSSAPLKNLRDARLEWVDDELRVVRGDTHELRYDAQGWREPPATPSEPSWTWNARRLPRAIVHWDNEDPDAPTPLRRCAITVVDRDGSRSVTRALDGADVIDAFASGDEIGLVLQHESRVKIGILAASEVVCTAVAALDPDSVTCEISDGGRYLLLAHESTRRDAMLIEIAQIAECIHDRIPMVPLPGLPE